MKVNAEGQTLESFLAHYDPNRYERPSVTVDILVFTKTDGRLSLLLVKRKNHPFIGKWVLPGGFVEMSENLEDAAARELEEETGLKNLPMFQIGAYGDVGRDPRTRIITVAFAALSLPNTLHPKAGDDAADAGLFFIEHRMHKQGADNTHHSISLRKNGINILIEAEEQGQGILSRKTLTIPGLGSDHGLIVLDALLCIEHLDSHFLAENLG